MKIIILIAISALTAYANTVGVNTENLLLKTFKGHSFYVNSVAFSPDGKYIASGSGDGAIRIWDAFLPTFGAADKAPGKWIKTFKINSWINSVAFSPDGKYIVSASDDGIIRLLEVSAAPIAGTAASKLNKNHIKIFSGHGDFVESVFFSPDGKYIISGSGDNTIRLWDISAGKCIRIFNKKDVGIARKIIFSPNGKYIAFTDLGGMIKMLSISDGLLKRRFKGHSLIHSIAFSLDGKYLVSGSDDGKIKLWDVSSGKCLKILKGHPYSVMTVSFSPDGRYIASGGHKIIKFWNVSSGECVETIDGHAFFVMSLSFSPDGKYLVSGSRDKTIKMWLTPWEAKRMKMEKYISQEKKKLIFKMNQNYEKYFAKGEKLIKKGRFKEAVELFIKSREYKSNNKKVKNKIAYCIKRINEISLKEKREKETEEIEETEMEKTTAARLDRLEALQSQQVSQKTGHSFWEPYYWIIIMVLLLAIAFLFHWKLAAAEPE